MSNKRFNQPGENIMNDKRTVDQARIQLGEFNDESMPLEHCVQDMRLASERLKKTVAEAEKEIAITKDLVKKQENLIRIQEELVAAQEREIQELKEESLCDRARF